MALRGALGEVGQGSDAARKLSAQLRQRRAAEDAAAQLERAAREAAEEAAAKEAGLFSRYTEQKPQDVDEGSREIGVGRGRSGRGRRGGRSSVVAAVGGEGGGKVRPGRWLRAGAGTAAAGASEPLGDPSSSSSDSSSSSSGGESSGSMGKADSVRSGGGASDSHESELGGGSEVDVVMPVYDSEDFSEASSEGAVGSESDDAEAGPAGLHVGGGGGGSRSFRKGPAEVEPEAKAVMKKAEGRERWRMPDALGSSSSGEGEGTARGGDSWGLCLYGYAALDAAAGSVDLLASIACYSAVAGSRPTAAVGCRPAWSLCAAL